jgi:RNA polymerase sigma-70 factor (ECF subfamily)
MDLTTPNLLQPAADAELLADLRTGAAGAFEALVRQHGGPMLASIRRLLANEADAHDALQDAFLSAWRALDRFDGRSQLSTWLHRIAVNAALQKLRARSRKPSRSLEELLPAFLEDGHQAHPARAWQATGDQAVELQETRGMVRAAIAELPEPYQTVLLLRDIEGFDTEETASQLGVPAGVVKTRLHRARQALRTLLDPHLCRGAI